MDRALYVAMTGARQTLLAQAANANNLANVSTPGFRADLAQLRSQPLFGPGLPSRVYAMTERPGFDARPGVIERTGRSLDVAIDGAGWIAVQAPDGSEALTRAGALRVAGPTGLLETAEGHPVLGNGGPIVLPPAESIEIGADGTISVRPLGQGANELLEIDRIKLVDPPAERLLKGEDGLVRVEGGGASPPDAAVRLVSGALEGSNVSMVAGLVEMIELARRFELQVQMMQTVNENESATAQVVSLG